MGKPANLLKRATEWEQRRYAERVLGDYEPFLHIRDVKKSEGRRHRIPWYITGRLHHLMSDLEAAFFYYFGYLLWVCDIREQFPLLPLEETVEIAKSIGCKHPSYGGKLHVVTTDQVLTLSNNPTKPLFIKPSAELENPRVIEKAEIERVYWARRNEKLWICTEKALPSKLISAVKWVHSYNEGHGIFKNPEELLKHKLLVNDYVNLHREEPLATACLTLDKTHGKRAGTSLAVARHLLANRAWPLDLREGIDTLKPLPWIES